MRLFSYFYILVLGTYIGKQVIGIGEVYLWVNILEEFGVPSPSTSKIIVSFLSIPGWAFTLFLLFRIYVCIKHKKLIIPDKFIGGYYVVGLILVSLSLLAILITLISAFGLPVGGMSGVPMAMVLIPTGFVSLIIMLRFEITAIRDFLRNAS